MDFNFTNADLANFKSRGIQPDAVREQMNNF